MASVFRLYITAFYVAAKATYIRLLYGKIVFFGWEGGGFVFFLFFLFVRHATMLGTESLDGTYTH